MLRANLFQATVLAQEFLELAKEQEMGESYNKGRVKVGTKKSSALRRKSMELSRKLSQLRNERY